MDAFLLPRPRGQHAQQERVRARRHEHVGGQGRRPVVADPERQAERGRGQDAGHQHERHPPWRDEPDGQRGEQVELLLDGERPRRGQKLGAEPFARRHEEVLGKGEVRPRRQQPPRGHGGQQPALGQRGERERGGHDHDVGGKDPAGAAKVEGVVVARGVAPGQQDATDQEAGEHEEEVHPAPGPAQGRPQHGRVAPRHHVRDVVADDHEQDGHAAKAVQLRQAAWGQRGRGGALAVRDPDRGPGGGGRAHAAGRR